MLLPLVIVAVVVWWQWPTSGTVATVDVTSNAPRYRTLDELAGASDLIVVGTVSASGDGRAITDPADPGTGIRTVLLRITAEQVLAGAAPDLLVVEHESALLDGTPITVDGVALPEVGERAVFFLVAGDGETLPYYAVVGPQGRYRLDGSSLTPVTSDELASEIASLGLADLAAKLT